MSLVLCCGGVRKVAAVRRGLHEVLPPELLGVFDHLEFAMLLNGHHADGDTDFAVSI